ncbi:MAG: PQQ-binding-like beta-propeller repeat protein [Candidatus Adiutrix sp.]|nr:PQQ-binding-like beta-propeller repeat protein [Candidatus Adiutrix sp.]
MAGACPGLALAFNGEEFLSLCAGEGGPVEVEALQKALDGGAEVNFAGPRGLTPLMAFVAGHSDRDLSAVAALRVLLQAGAKINATSQEGATALSYAVLHKAGPRLIAALLQEGAEVNLGVSGRGGLTPLMLAASLEPDPVVTALLLAAGADPTAVAQKDGRAITMPELARKNTNPKVRALIEAALKLSRPVQPGRPLFAELPAEVPAQTIQALDQQIRHLAGADNWPAWLGYIQWQTAVASAVETRQKTLGNSLAEAWVNEYQFYLQSLTDSLGQAPRPGTGESGPGRLIIQGRAPESGPLTEAAAFNQRKIVVLRQPGQGALVAYETATGRELWRYTPSALSGFHLLNRPAGLAGNSEPLLLVSSHWGGQFGEAAILDPLNGAVLWESPPLDSPRWAVDDRQTILAVSTDYSLDLFDLKKARSIRRSWYDLLESQPWAEAGQQARREQNKILAKRSLKLGQDGQFLKNNTLLFQDRPQVSTAALDKARASLKEHTDPGRLEELPVTDRSGADPSFILASAEPGAPLFLVNQRDDLIDYLMIDNDQGRKLTRGTLGWAGEGGGRRPLISFSPSGAVLALTETTGDIHFFAVAGGSRYLGRLAGSTLLEPESGRQVKDCRLTAILDDDLSGRPFIALAPAEGARAPLVVEAELARSQITSSFRPQPGASLGLTAFAASSGDQWAVGLTNGEVWRIDPAKSDLGRVALPAGLSWTALAFSGDGRKLLAADRKGGLYLTEPGQDFRHLALELKNISRLAVDQAGQYAWVAADNNRLALIDLSGQAKPLYRQARGPVVSLAFHPEAGYAVAVEALPASPEAKAPGPAAPPVTRWAQGRLDIISYDSEKSFIGLSPDLSAVLYQELRPGRAFVNLGLESLSSRDQSELASFTGQARLGQAVFSPDRRLALLPEAGRAEDGSPVWNFNNSGAFYLYDLAGGREIGYLADRTLQPEGLIGAAFSRQPGRAVTAGRDGSLRLWDISGVQPVNLQTYVFLKNGNWVMMNQEGRFDSPQPEAVEGLHWAAAGQTKALEPILIGPAVKITRISPEKDGSARVAVTVEVSAPGQGEILARDLTLYCDGRPVARHPEQENQPLKLTDGRFQTTFHQLPLPSEQNRAVFRASFLSHDQSQRQSAEVAVKYKIKEPEEPQS